MAKLTVTVDGGVLRRARSRALERGTSVDALVRDCLRQIAGPSTAADGIAEFLAAVRGAGAGSGGQGRTWTRDDLYLRREGGRNQDRTGPDGPDEPGPA